MTIQKTKQLGQGMTEYIIIVALIAIVAITVFNIFGDTVRGQVGDMAAELGGGGHPKAAGALVEGDLDSVIEKVLNVSISAINASQGKDTFSRAE